MKVVKGKPFPLGVERKDNKVNFTVQVDSKSICKLRFYSQEPTVPIYEYSMEECKTIKGIRFIAFEDWDHEIVSYAYEIDGVETIDARAKCVLGRESWGQESAGSLKALISEESWEWEEKESLNIPAEEVVSYRLHVRGFTIHNSSKVKHKGTFQGLIEKVPYLLELGINQVQLLPSYEFLEEGSRVNYWGYAPGYHMSPKSSYSSDENVVKEFGTFIENFHENGIEVILDMPFVGAEEGAYQLETLRYYALRFHVDGFLLNPSATDIAQVQKDSVLKNIKIITQEEGFQIAMRRFLKGDEDMVKEVIWRLKEKSNKENHLVYNSITSHNGFTMHDLVSYDDRHNELNGEQNHDGPEYNYCWNCGAEGATRKKNVLELRQKQVRNAWALLMLAQGTPCILSGDEFGNSQKGNNNAYCQDNEISWLNWKQIEKNKELFHYVKELIAFRKTHKIFHQRTILKGMDNMACGMPDVSYHGELAWQVPSQVASRQLGVMYCGKYTNENDYFVAYNMHWVEHEYALPALAKGKQWYQVMSTVNGNFVDGVLLDNQRIAPVSERSIVIFEGR